MFAKDISQLQYADIDDLVNVRKEREGYSLDYKTSFGNPDKAKKELAKDISAFANTGGGYLIIGVDKDYVISGVDQTIQNRPVDEWINQVLSSNIEPPLFYFDPKTISIPNSDKVVVVIHVPESTKKPHIVTEWNNYQIRMNDSSKSANHSQIRDMFELSRLRSNEFNHFLMKRNLLNEEDKNFGRNKNVKELLSEVPTKLKRPTPLVVFSLIPKYPNEERIELPIVEFHDWLQKHSKGYEPVTWFSLFHGLYEYDLRLDGMIMQNMKGKELSSYFEVLNTGYVEAGFSSTFIQVYSDQRGYGQQSVSNGAVALTPIVAYEMMLLWFAKKLYSFIKYNNEVMIQVSFVDTIGFMPSGLHGRYRNGWHTPPSNKQHNNFKLTYSFNPTTLTDEIVLKIAKHHSVNICRAFGITQDYCFVDDKLDLSEMQHVFI
jgi:hypothetical protein